MQAIETEEVSREAQEAREAGHAGSVHPEVRLRTEADRVPAPGTRSTRPRVRLKESIEVFPASDGALYLLRLGAGDDLVLPDPGPEDRALLKLLGEGYRTAAELEAELERRGLAGDVGESLELLEAADVLETEPGPEVLQSIDAERLDRQLVYLADLAGPGLSSHDLQRRLLDSKVLLLGCGALGCWTASTLAGAGVGALVLLDDDRVELSNLNRQILFAEDQLGELKVRAAESSLRAHNHRLDVEGVVLRVRGPRDLAAHLDGVDLVIATADWPPHELPRWVNEACLRASVPYMTAGQFPPRARIGPLVIPGRTACLECLERRTRREYPLYDELSRHRAQGSTPEAAMATTSAVIGALLASEAMHHLMGVESRLASRAMLLDLRRLVVELEEVGRDPACPLCGELARAAESTAPGSLHTSSFLLKSS